MSEYKYPYIPRPYYPAVMFAAKMVREGEGRNMAVRTAASYYGVDEEGVSKHLAARAAAGRKARQVKTTYKWYIVSDMFGCEATGFENTLKVVRGKDRNTIERRLFRQDMDYNRRHDMNGSSYSQIHWCSIVGEYSTKKEAEYELSNFKEANRD